MKLATLALSMLFVLGCAAPRGGGGAANEPSPASGESEETSTAQEAESGAEPAAEKAACKPDGTEVSHYSECCSNEAFVEEIQDPVNGAWHSGRRLCGRGP